MKKLNKTAFAIGTSIVAGLGSTTVIAANNPFESTELAAGYLNIAEAGEQDGSIKAKDGSCGEGKCGNKTDKSSKAKEGTCGDKKMMRVKLWKENVVKRKWIRVKQRKENAVKENVAVQNSVDHKFQI